MKIFNTDFIPNYIFPIENKGILLSGEKTVIFDLEKNANIYENFDIQNCAYYNNVIYGFNKEKIEIYELNYELKIVRKISIPNVRFKFTNFKIYQNILILQEVELCYILVYDFENNNILFSAKYDNQNPIFFVENYIFGFMKNADENNEIYIEKGEFCANIELIQKFLNAKKYENAMKLVISDKELQNLNILKDLLIQITRKRHNFNTSEFKDFFEIISNLENSTKNKSSQKNILVQKQQINKSLTKPDILNGSTLWASVVLHQIKEKINTRIKNTVLHNNQLKRQNSANFLFSERMLKKQEEYRKTARWGLYISWYKNIFLNKFQCIYLLSKHSIEKIHKKRRVMKNTLLFIAKNTPPEQILKIGQENCYTDYRAFKWIMRTVIGNLIGKNVWNIRLTERMNKFILQIYSEYDIMEGIKLAKNMKNTILIKELKNSLILLRKIIVNYSL